MSCNKDNAFILFHVIRERWSEQQVWVTHVALLVDEDVQKRMDITQNPEKNCRRASPRTYSCMADYTKGMG